MLTGRCGIRAHAAESVEGRVQGGGGQDNGADEAGGEAGGISAWVHLDADILLRGTTIHDTSTSQITCYGVQFTVWTKCQQKGEYFVPQAKRIQPGFVSDVPGMKPPTLSLRQPISD